MKKLLLLFGLLGLVSFAAAADTQAATTRHCGGRQYVYDVSTLHVSCGTAWGVVRRVVGARVLERSPGQHVDHVGGWRVVSHIRCTRAGRYCYHKGSVRATASGRRVVRFKFDVFAGA